MHDGLFLTSARRTRWLIAATLVAACSKPDAAPPASGASAPVATSADASTGAGSCPATGRWAECSILYRLDRSGLVPKIDSSAKPAETTLAGTPLIIKIGTTGTLELHVYPDSAARAAASAKLDRTKFIDATSEQTIARERTLIESSNVIGLLTSLNGHQRERVSDALMAGPPQPQRAPQKP
jgi:hypothetical protein